MVYVVSKSGKPLMPTDRYGHIRKLLKNKLAVPICNNPFTIKLKYETPEVVQPLTMGIDVGRENIGLGVSDEKGNGLFRANVQTNNKSVTKNMSERKVHRQERRRHKRQRKQRKALRLNQAIKNGNDSILRNKKPCKQVDISYPGMEESISHKVIKGKEAKFNNRKRPKGWLTPSARNLVEIHVNLVKKIAKFLPIIDLVIENNIFDFQKLENIDIRNWEYQQGPLYGFKDYKDYISKQQNGHCLLCNNKIDHYHHIYYCSNNGSNTPQNYVGLCESCHILVHNDSSYEQDLLDRKQGLKKKYEIGLLNSCMGNIIEELSLLYPTKVCFGYDTKQIRNKFNLDKDHNIDGFVISLFDKNIDSINLKSDVYTIRHFKKKSHNIISKVGRRKYYLEGKLVATNRHKAFNQKEDSLKEFLSKYSESHLKQEVDRLVYSLEIKPATRVYTYHKKGFVSPFKCGDIVHFYKKDKKGNVIDKVFSCQSVKYRNRGNPTVVDIDGKEYNLNYCSLLESNSLVFV